MSLTPESWEQWIGALGATGGAVLAAWKYGQRISGWCHDRWTSWRNATALRAAEQAEAEKAVRVLNETIALLELRNREQERRLTDLREDKRQADAEIDRLWQRTRDLEATLDGSRR